MYIFSLLRYFFFLFILYCFYGCSTLNVGNDTNIDISQDPSYALRQMAGNQLRTSGANQKVLLRNIKETKRQYSKLTEELSGNVAKQWSDKDITLPSVETYVKYSNNYKVKASINFSNGAIRIESVAGIDALQKAIVNTLLMSQNPNNVDLYSSSEVDTKGAPFLAGLVKDNKGNDITTLSSAREYAQYLIDNSLKDRNDSNGKLVHYVDLQMVGDYQSKSELKYEAIVQKYAHKYNVSPALILGIIQTESNFNPYAVSNAPAYGLMQVVPSTAGADAYELINGKKGMPTKEMLFDPETNIQYGVAYLSILFNRYLQNIKNKESQEYCVITSYNAGAGNVLRTFHSDKAKAIEHINSLSASKVYDILHTKLSSEEGRRYLFKVTNHKKNYEHIK